MEIFVCGLSREEGFIDQMISVSFFSFILRLSEFERVLHTHLVCLDSVGCYKGKNMISSISTEKIFHIYFWGFSIWLPILFVQRHLIPIFFKKLIKPQYYLFCF